MYNLSLRLFYLNVLIVFFFLTNIHLIFYILVLIKSGHFLRLESESGFEIEVQHEDIENEELEYVEQDIDTDYEMDTSNQDDYLFYNCRFFFSFYGGNHLLELEHYHIIENKYNIYNNIYNKRKYDEEHFNNYYNNYDINRCYYYKFLLTNLNNNKFNIINNFDNIKFINELKREKRIKLWKK